MAMAGSPGSTRLPYDMLAHVITWAPRSTWTTLCLVSRDIHHLVVPSVYRVANFDFDPEDKAHNFLQTIARSDTLGALVHHHSIDRLGRDDDVPIFVPALRNMPNLRHFHCRQLGAVYLHDPTVFDVIANLSSLKSVQAVWSTKYNLNLFLDRLPPLESIDVDPDGNRMDALERLLVRSLETLKSLATEDWELEPFLERRPPGTVWPHMTELTVFDLHGASPLRAFPNLEALHISMNCIGPVEFLWDPAILPRLRKLLITATPVPVHVNRSKRRSLQHLHVCVPTHMEFTEAGLLDFMSAFRWQDLLSLDLTLDWNMDCAETLDAMIGIIPVVLAESNSLQLLSLFIEIDPDIVNRYLSQILKVSNPTSEKPSLPALRYLRLWCNSEGGDEASTIATSTVEGRSAELFACISNLHIMQLQLGRDKTVSWQRHLGGVHVSESCARIPEWFSEVGDFLEETAAD